LYGAAPVAPRAHADDWGVTRDPFDKTVIARYKAMLVHNPHDAGALAKLLELYRRYRTIDQLESEYAKSSDWASLVVLGRIEHSRGDDADALEKLQGAVAAQPNDAASWLLVGELQKSKPTDARNAYDKALAAATDKPTKKTALRALADLALAAGDNAGADAYFQQFLALEPGNAQLWIERGDAMMNAKKPDAALESYTAAEKLVAGDPSRRIEVVARRGQALEAAGKDDEAVAEYRRAIKLAPKGYYLEVELTGRIVEIYERKQAVATLLAQYEKEWPEASRGHFEWDTLGKLYMLTGQQDKAITALKHAVAKAPWELETQRKLIAQLENSGRDDEALAAYEAVVRVAPGDATFQLELAERYWRRGQEKKALEVLQHLDARFPTDASVLGSVADLYTRWGKDDLAIGLYERLAKLEPEEPGHLVTLGEQYWQKGDKAKAQATWKRLALSGKPAGFAKLGEVLAEHGDPIEAKANFDKAIKLDDKNPELFKARGVFLESQKAYPEAVADWETVLSLVGTEPKNRMARREGRRHLVAVITRWGAKESAYKAKWDAAFKAGDAEAGYFLVEYYTKRPSKDQPLATLEELHKRTIDDQDVTMDLVKAYRAARRYDDAVKTLLALEVQAQSREREIYSLISEIKTEARQDDEAIEWAQRALAKNNSDPQAYERLAERYVEMQRFPEAIKAYETAIQYDAHDAKAQFALAQLYVQANEPQKAAERLRTVLRTATDEETVGRAGREAIDLEEMTGTLGELEKVMSPLAFMMAHKPVYRHVLVDLYLRYVPRLAERERHGNAEVRAAAKQELARIGGHGLQPLLEALRDEKEPIQQREAVAVLGHLGNKDAAPALVRIAITDAKDARHLGPLAENVDREVRIEALVAAGRLGDPSVLADVLPLAENPELALREAAIFTIGRSGDKRAVGPLVKALGDRRPSVPQLAALGLAQIDDPRVGPALVAILADPKQLDGTRAAAAYALGARKLAGAAAANAALVGALDDNRGDAQRLAAWALGQQGDAKALGPLVRAYFARAGRPADELVWAIARASGAPGVGPMIVQPIGEYPMRGGSYDKAAGVALLPGPLPAAPMSGKLVVEHADDIGRGLAEALDEHRDVVVAVLEDLDARPDRIALGALDPGKADAKVDAALAKIGAGIAPRIAALTTSEDAKVRALAVSLTAKLAPAPLDTLGKAMKDPADQVRAAALLSVRALLARRIDPAPVVPAILRALGSPVWKDRLVAAQAYGVLAAGGADPAPLVKAAGDESAFVREAVATALAPAASGGAAREAELKLSRDDIPQVRDAAKRALGTP
jgi:tetratricopeptide (TPR) repeat protein